MGDCFVGVIISVDCNFDILDGIELSGFCFMVKFIKFFKLRVLLNSLFWVDGLFKIIVYMLFICNFKLFRNIEGIVSIKFLDEGLIFMSV